MKTRLDYVQLRQRRPWTEEQARAVLAALGASSQSLAAFCRSHGLVPQRLWWWRKRLGDGVSAVAAPMSLLPVEIVRARPTAVAIEAMGTSPFEVAVGDVVVRVPPDFDEAALRRLVRALGPC